MKHEKEMVNRPHRRSALWALAALMLFALPAGRPTQGATKPIDPALQEAQEVPNLPRVLLIGDSISMGYTPLVRTMLQGKANVQHPKQNCADTAFGLKRLDDWLGQEKWDVIHFNFGLHDLKYLDAQGRYVGPDQGKQVALPEVYAENLQKLVDRLKQTHAKLIWASTTPVPAGSAGRVQGDEVRYNAVAAQVMAKNHIPVDDLCAVAMRHLDKYQLPHNVHFTNEGYQALATSVNDSILKVLHQ